MSVDAKMRGALMVASVGSVIAIVVSACGSGGGGGESSGPSARSVQSVSVPATVEKDSIQDLNSTKDMTGVVTTLPETSNPYVGHLPPVCPLFPAEALKKLEIDSVLPGLNQEYFRSCSFGYPGFDGRSSDLGFFTENISELTEKNKSYDIVRTKVMLTARITSTILRKNFDQASNDCMVAWGTFYGSVSVSHSSNSGTFDEMCESAIELAKELAPYLPKSPSQMRKGT